MTPFYAIIRITELLSEISTKFTEKLSELSKIFNLVTKLKISYTEEQKLSSGFQETRADLLGELARELRQSTSLSASWLRSAAAKRGMTVTDLQVMDVLESTGPSTAATRSPGRNWSGCERRHPARRGSTPLRWEIWRAVGSSSPPGSPG